MEHVPCANQDACPLRDTRRGCFEDVHHRFFPRTNYVTRTEKSFRQLDENKVKICRSLHDAEHWAGEIPEKPDLEIMKLAIEEQRNRRIGDEQLPTGPTV